MLGAISTMVLVAYLVRDLVPVETILAPPNYGVSNSTARGWIVNPFNGRLSIAAGIGAVVPAMLVRIINSGHGRAGSLLLVCARIQ